MLCIFNCTVGISIVKIDKIFVLKTVDKDTKFSATVFINRKSSQKVWKAFLGSTVAMCLGYPNAILFNQGSQFQSTEFRSLLFAAGTKAQNTGVESHKAPEKTVMYHAYLCNIYERARTKHSKLRQMMTFLLSVKACSDTSSPAGMAPTLPTLLAFGVLLKISSLSG